MDIRRQISMVFHLDKCIGCHTCTVACKNVWTDRKGAEYMWWNNVETKPGTGYPTHWEDQEKYRGGWMVDGNELRLKLQRKGGALGNIFYNPRLPQLDDYYEPWTYKYQDLFDAPEGDDQPTARPVSMVSGEYMDIEAGPNWDDDLGGSPVYAANDPNLKGLDEEERRQLTDLERMVFFYLPRICNHCANPGCSAACPMGAIYKRGEDGIVLVSQEKCRGWRMCISGCPYKKVYYNWSTGKSEKCVLCFPRLETGQAPACFHSCVGRIRYLGVVLYDADRIEETAKVEEQRLVEAQREMILDPFDPAVIAAAKKNGISDEWIDAAQRSPVYKFVKRWHLALPLHPEFRTLPMLFYIPPLSPVMASMKKGSYDIEETEFFGTIDKARVPLQFMANLFSAGDIAPVSYVLRRLIAVRAHRRSVSVGDISKEKAGSMLAEVGLTPDEADGIFKLTSLPTYDERFVIPPYQRDAAIEELWNDPLSQKGETGFGFRARPKRGA